MLSRWTFLQYLCHFWHLCRQIEHFRFMRIVLLSRRKLLLSIRDLLCYQRFPLLYRLLSTNILGSIRFKLLHPTYQLVVWTFGCHIINYECDSAIFIVNSGNGFVFLLTCSIPERILYFSIFAQYCLFEVDSAKRRFKRLIEFVVYIANCETAFTYSNWADYNNLDW